MAMTSSERMRLWRDRHPGIDKINNTMVRREVLTHYGNGKCACAICGFSDIRALSIDHIEQRGINEKAARVKGEKTGTALMFYRKLRRDGYPKGYQTLCMNCQWIKRDINRECFQHS